MKFGFTKDDIEIALDELPDKNESSVVIYLMKKGIRIFEFLESNNHNFFNR